MKMETLVKGIQSITNEELTTLLRSVWGEGSETINVFSVVTRRPSSGVFRDSPSFGPPMEVPLYIQDGEHAYDSRTDNSLRAKLTIGQDVSGTEYVFFRPDQYLFNYGNPSAREARLLQLWPLCRPLREARTANQFLKVLFKFLKDTYRKPVSSGCVKAYVGNTKIFWVSKKPNSKKIAKIGREGRGEEWFLAEGNSLFHKVFDSLDEENYRYIYAYNSTEMRSYCTIGNKRYHIDLLVPIYERYFPETDELGSVARRILPTAATVQYRSYTRPTGETVFTTEPLPYAKLWQRPVHGYGERIENVLERSDLFRKGKVDLYARRPHEETPYLGWELEACYGVVDTKVISNRDDQVPTAFKKLLEKMVFCKADGSISPSGFETVSIPATLDFWKESGLDNALNAMRTSPYNMRSYDYKSCGFHVHVSRTALSVLDLQKIERFMHNPDNMAFLNAVAGRGETTYQKYFPDIFFNNRKNNTTNSEYKRERFVTSNTDRDLNQYFGKKTTKFAQFCRYLSFYVGADMFSGLPTAYLRMTKTFKQAIKDSIVLSDAIDYSSRMAVESYKQYSYWLSCNRNVEPFTQEEFLKTCFALAKGEHESSRQFHNNYKNYLRAALETWFGDKFQFESPTNDSWKAGLRKTKLPIGRKHNLKACHQIKGPLGKAAAGRYDVLNTTNQNTVEFRLFKGTMNPDSVFRYLEFVDAIVRFVPSTSATNEGLSYKVFLKWLSKDSFNVLRYEKLVAFLVTKNFIDRSAIRRRDLAVVEEKDSVNLPSPISAEVPVPTPELEYGNYDYEEGNHCGDPACSSCNDMYGEI